MTETTRKRFAKLFVDSHKSLRRYAGRLLHSPQSAEDLVQEAFLRTFEQADRVEVPRAFLFSTTRNLAFDVRRNVRTRKTSSVGDFDALNVVSNGESPEGGLLADEQSRLLREAVERLSPQCRVVFALRVFHDCSYKEIALRLGLSAKTVENHIARGVREIHDYLRRRYQIAPTSEHD
jgi:RNA polymerase sigma-70 factor (ECF subfamily)